MFSRKPCKEALAEYEIQTYQKMVQNTLAELSNILEVIIKMAENQRVQYNKHIIRLRHLIQPDLVVSQKIPVSNNTGKKNRSFSARGYKYTPANIKRTQLEGPRIKQFALPFFTTYTFGSCNSVHIRFNRFTIPSPFCPLHR